MIFHWIYFELDQVLLWETERKRTARSILKKKKKYLLLVFDNSPGCNSLGFTKCLPFICSSRLHPPPLEAHLNALKQADNFSPKSQSCKTYNSIDLLSLLWETLGATSSLLSIQHWNKSRKGSWGHCQVLCLFINLPLSPLAS